MLWGFFRIAIGINHLPGKGLVGVPVGSGKDPYVSKIKDSILTFRKSNPTLVAGSYGISKLNLSSEKPKTVFELLEIDHNVFKTQYDLYVACSRTDRNDKEITDRRDRREQVFNKFFGDLKVALPAFERLEKLILSSRNIVSNERERLTLERANEIARDIRYGGTPLVFSEYSSIESFVKQYKEIFEVYKESKVELNEALKSEQYAEMIKSKIPEYEKTVETLSVDDCESLFKKLSNAANVLVETDDDPVTLKQRRLPSIETSRIKAADFFEMYALITALYTYAKKSGILNIPREEQGKNKFDVIGTFNSGTLTEYGWHAKDSKNTRWSALSDAIQAYGPRHIIRCLQLIGNTHKQYQKECLTDIELIEDALILSYQPKINLP